MKSKRQNHQINEIISLSQNYKLHRFNLDSMKPAIDASNQKRTTKIDKLKNEKLRYRKAIRQFNNTSLQRQNDNLVKRIKEAAVKRQKQVNEKLSRIKGLQESRLSSRSNRKLNSVSSSKSFTSVSSNYRQRIKRQKEIDRENMKLARRITNPKSIRTLAISELNKSYQKQQQHVRTRSRYSQKNKEIIKSLALQGLRFDKKDVQYLPQLTYKKELSRSPSVLSQQKSLKKLSSTSRLH